MNESLEITNLVADLIMIIYGKEIQHADTNGYIAVSHWRRNQGSMNLGFQHTLSMISL